MSFSVDLPRALAAIAGFHATTYILYATLPASRIAGYVRRADGSPSSTRLPAFVTSIASCAAAAGLVYARVLPATAIFDNVAAAASASCAFGVIVASAFYVRGRSMRAAGIIDERARCSTVDEPAPRAGTGDVSEFRGRSELAHFYCGLSEYNPELLAVDVKMWLYATGAILLALNAASALAADAIARGGAPGTATSTTFALLSFFLLEYVWQEKVHCWTYDILRERMGFKLLWGCLFFYPFAYALPIYESARVAGDGRDCSSAVAAAAVVLFFSGWVLTRGANLQKFACKSGVTTGRALWGLVRMETVPGSGGRVLCSGFWGVSRHVNYLGEIIQALALAIPAVAASGSPLALLYPAYYVALFVPRQVDDDAVCERKYGKAVWGAYVQRVPWRIVPYVY